MFWKQYRIGSLDVVVELRWRLVFGLGTVGDLLEGWALEVFFGPLFLEISYDVS